MKVTHGGAGHKPLGLQATRAFAAALPEGRLELLPEAGHQAWLDRPDLFFPLLDAFLRGQALP